MYNVALLSTEMYRVIQVVQSCTVLNRIDLYSNLKSCTQLYRAVQNLMELSEVVQSFTILYKNCTDLYKVVQTHKGLYRICTE